MSPVSAFILVLLAASAEQALLIRPKRCPCAQVLPNPCNCWSGFRPHCTCIQPPIHYSCGCGIQSQFTQCQVSCQRTCLPTCAQTQLLPSACPSTCQYTCANSCAPQRLIPIQIVMPKIVALSPQCVPACQQSCSTSCLPMMPAATCLPLCRQPCVQRCAQFAPLMNTCLPQCRPSCSPQCNSQVVVAPGAPVTPVAPALAPSPAPLPLIAAPNPPAAGSPPPPPLPLPAGVTGAAPPSSYNDPSEYLGEPTPPMDYYSSPSTPFPGSTPDPAMLPAADPLAEAGLSKFEMTTLSPVPLLSAEPQPRLPPPPSGPSAGLSAPMPPNMYQQFDGPMPSSTPFPDYMGIPLESEFDIMRKKMSEQGLDRGHSANTIFLKNSQSKIARSKTAPSKHRRPSA